MPKRIYIDLGANAGETVARYMANSISCDVYAFEPNPKLAKLLKERFKDKNVFVSDKAAWIIDGVMPLYLGHDLSSTLLKGKKALEDYPEYSISYEHHTLVPTLDFARWLLEHVSPNDHVEIKIDIEGAEYKLLQRLVDTDAIDLVDVLKCEFHQDRFPISVDDHNRIIDLVQKRTSLIKWK